MLRVLVTRPQPAAAHTAGRLKSRGLEPIVLPLARIAPLNASLPEGAHPFSAAAVTSANAVRNLPPALWRALKGLPLFAVGPGTAAAARAAGFAQVITGERDAAALADLIVASLPPSARIAYLCGRPRRPDFEDALAAGGHEVAAIEIYETRDLVPDDATARQALGGRAVDVALVYSPDSARRLCELAVRPPLQPLFVSTRFACISGAAAALLGAFAPDRIMIAAQPSEEALLQLILPVAIPDRL